LLLIYCLKFQINQCNFSINLLASSLLIKVTSQSKERTLYIIDSKFKVTSQLNITMSNHVYSLTFYI